MKHQLPLFILGALMVLPHPVGAIPKFAFDDEWARAKIQMPTGQKPLGDMLLLYSRLAQANVFADVTSLSLKTPVDSPADFVPSKFDYLPRSRGSAMSLIISKAKMWEDRTEPNTFVAWPQEDLNKLINLIVAEQQKFEEANPAGDRATTIAELKKFLLEKGWNPDAQTVAEKTQNAQGIKDIIRLNDLPPALRASILSELILRLRTLRDGYMPAAWTDDFWKNARIRVRTASLVRGMQDSQGKLHPPGSVPQVCIWLPPVPGVNEQIYPIGVVLAFKVAWQAPVAKQVPRAARLAAPRHRPVCAPAELTPPQGAPVPEQVAPPSDTGFTFDASGETALQKQVSFVHQGVAPSVVVAGWSEQSGVSLRLAPDVAPKTKVVALSSGMTLSSAMTAMARLLSAQWSKEGNGFVLHSAHLDELHLMMAHMGDLAYYPFKPHSYEESLRNGSELAEQIATSVDEDQLKSADGVAFSSLPPELQHSVVSLMRDENMGEMIVSQQRVDDALSPDVQLRFAPLSKDTPQLFAYKGSGIGQFGGSPSARWRAYTAEGYYITDLFPELSARAPSQMDIFLQNRDDVWKAAKARKAQEKARQEQQDEEEQNQ